MIKIKTASSKKEMSTQRIPLHRSCEWWMVSKRPQVYAFTHNHPQLN